MKHLYTTLLLSLVVSSGFTQTYKTYTAKASGNWSNVNTWNSVNRTDGVSKNKYIIPTSSNIVANNSLNYLTLGDVEVFVDGSLIITAGTLFNLTQNSSIVVTGTIRTTGASAVAIGNSWKYITLGTSTITGPVFTDFLTTGFSVFGVLPVQYLSFTATKNNDNSVLLKWSTSNEINNSHFEIERSVNGRDWTKIGSVNAVHSNNSVNTYSFMHYQSASPMNAYRLKQVDKDGGFDYSAVTVISYSQATAAEIYTENKSLHINFNGEVRSNIVVKLVNPNGQVMLSQSLHPGSAKTTIATSHLTKGVYIVQVSDNNSFHAVRKIMIH